MRMKLAIELTPPQSDRLRAEAERLGVPLEELARAVVADALATPEPDFSDAMEYVLEKNRELYRRLA